MRKLVATEIKIISQLSVFHCSCVFGNKGLADGSHDLHREIQDAKVECMSIIQIGYDGKMCGLRMVAYCPYIMVDAEPDQYEGNVSFRSKNLFEGDGVRI